MDACATEKSQDNIVLLKLITERPSLASQTALARARGISVLYLEMYM